MKHNTIRPTIAAIIIGIAIAGFLTISGCNTMEGVGEDVEDLGDTIQEGAREHR